MQAAERGGGGVDGVAARADGTAAVCRYGRVLVHVRGGLDALLAVIVITIIHGVIGFGHFELESARVSGRKGVKVTAAAAAAAAADE